MRQTAILFIAALLLMPCAAQADISPYIGYQGVLRDASGNPVPDGSYMVTFRIYNVAQSGSPLWTETHTLGASDGIINATLGLNVPLSSLEFDVPYWLGISVAGEPELVPRTPMTTVPYAAHAGYADTCLEGDEDWTIAGDNVYHDVGNVGIGTPTPGVRLDVLEANAPCARLENSGTNTNFTLQVRNNSGLGGVFYGGWGTVTWPITPAAIYAKSGAGYTGGRFDSYDEPAVYAYADVGRAIYARTNSGDCASFTGGPVVVEDMLRTDEFQLNQATAVGYVLTTDGTGVGTWQAPAAAPDGDWTLSGSDMYSAVSGEVGIGDATPVAKLDVSNATTLPALQVTHSGASMSRGVNIERTSVHNAGNDLLQLKIPSGSSASSQFIECENSGTNRFIVDGDGFVTTGAGAEFGGTVTIDGELYVDAYATAVGNFTGDALSNNSSVLSGVCTGVGTGYDPTGVYGESVPGDDYGVGGEFVGGYHGARGFVYPNGTDHYRGVYGAVTAAAGSHIGTNYGVYGLATGGDYNYGVYGRATDGNNNYAGYFDGHAHVQGTFTATVKYFRIDHPLDPANSYLQHACVESDEMMNIYNGNVVLDARGEAWVEMPDWFEALNRDFRYQLTAIGAPGPNLYVAERISGNRFRVAGGEPGSEVSWQVTGVRHDPIAAANPLTVELDKPAEHVGKYMLPEAYGLPATAGIDYHEERASERGATGHSAPAARERLADDGE